MIRVDPKPEPPEFNTLVRAKGLSAIAELVGEPPTLKRPGPRRGKVAERREDIDPKHFDPFWREMTKELLTSYGRICAYACLYIERTTGLSSVDHWAPKSKRWDQVYEWNNYRLACHTMNTLKREFDDVIDPFEVTEGMFALDLVQLKAVPGPEAGEHKALVESTITRLRLDQSDYAKDLEGYYEAYQKGDITLRYLERRAPFLAREMRRQGKLREGDA